MVHLLIGFGCALPASIVWVSVFAAGGLGVVGRLVNSSQLPVEGDGRVPAGHRHIPSMQLDPPTQTSSGPQWVPGAEMARLVVLSTALSTEAG